MEAVSNVPFQRDVLLSQSDIEIFALQLVGLDRQVGVRCRPSPMLMQEEVA